MTPTWTPARNSCRACSLMAKDMGEGCHVAPTRRVRRSASGVAEIAHRGRSPEPASWTLRRVAGRLPPHFSTLLMDLLMDSPESAVTGRTWRHRPTRETPGQADFPGAGVIRRHRREPPHNPKVVGSNPTPATK